MDLVQRTMHTIPAKFIGVEPQRWYKDYVDGKDIYGEPEPTAWFQLTGTTMGWNLGDITDVIITVIGEDFGLEVKYRKMPSVDPNRLHLDASSLQGFLAAWKDAHSQ